MRSLHASWKCARRLWALLAVFATALSCRAPETVEPEDSGITPACGYSMAGLVGEATHIYTAKIVDVDKAKQRMAIRLIEPLKGKTEIRKIQCDLSMPQYAWELALLLKDLAEGQQAILFFKLDEPGNMKSLLYSDGCFLQFIGDYDPKRLDSITIPFTHLERRMNQTFSGTTIRLLSILRDALEGKRSLPAVWPFMPELSKKTLASKTREPLIDFEDSEAVQKALVNEAAARLAKPAPAKGSGTGLRGYYYGDDGLKRLEMCRIDPTIDFNWKNEGPTSTLGQGDDFSVRWVGEVQPQYSEAYTFYTTGRDIDNYVSFLRVWVDGKLVCCHDEDTSEEHSIWKGTLALNAGEKYKIEMEFCGEIARLMWASKNQEPEVIPASQLYPAPDDVDDRYVEAVYSLTQLMEEVTHVYTAKVTDVDRVNKRMSIRLIDPIKGKTDIKKIHYNLSQSPHDWHSAFALKDMTAGQQAILFFKQEQPGDMYSLLFSNGYFMQCVGNYDLKNIDNIWIPFSKIDCALNRTFSGATIRLLSLLRQAVEGKKPLPEPRPELSELTLESMMARPAEPTIDFEDAAAIKKALDDLPPEDK